MEQKEHGFERKREVRIHINRKEYVSPNPTNGAALYKLGRIADYCELFRAVDGNHEDVRIFNDDNVLQLREDMHFYSQNEVTIIVNARPKIVIEEDISFTEIVALAFETPPTGENVTFTIAYRNGPLENQEGCLSEGRYVRVREGMIFNVTATDKS